MKEYIYLLPEYANQKNIKHNLSETQDEYEIEYLTNQTKISLTETNSLTEDEYSLNLKSSKYKLEGFTEIKESMIHHHKKGHQQKHLQFKIQSKKETIRIFLDALDNEEYKKCIKGFLNIAKDIIIKEQKNNNIKENLKKYFFSEQIDYLTEERKFLLEKIGKAKELGKIIGEENKKIEDKRFLELKEEPDLKPFFKNN